MKYCLFILCIALFILIIATIYLCINLFNTSKMLVKSLGKLEETTKRAEDVSARFVETKEKVSEPVTIVTYGGMLVIYLAARHRFYKKKKK